MRNFERKREYIVSDSIDIQVEIEPMEFDDMAKPFLETVKLTFSDHLF